MKIYCKFTAEYAVKKFKTSQHFAKAVVPCQSKIILKNFSVLF